MGVNWAIPKRIGILLAPQKTKLRKKEIEKIVEYKRLDEKILEGVDDEIETEIGIEIERIIRLLFVVA